MNSILTTKMVRRDIMPLIENAFKEANIVINKENEFSITDEQISIIEKELERCGIPLGISDLALIKHGE